MNNYEKLEKLREEGYTYQNRKDDWSISLKQTEMYCKTCAKRNKECYRHVIIFGNNSKDGYCSDWSKFKIPEVMKNLVLDKELFNI